MLMAQELIAMQATSAKKAVQFKMNVLMVLSVLVHRQQYYKHVQQDNTVDKVPLAPAPIVVQVSTVKLELNPRACAYLVHFLLTTMVSISIPVGHVMAQVGIVPHTFHHH